MNTIIAIILLAVAGAQAGYLSQPAVYAAPLVKSVAVATPVLRAEYPSYAVHSPALGSLGYSTYAAPAYAHAAPVYAAPLALGYSSGLSYGAGYAYGAGYGGAYGGFFK